MTVVCAPLLLITGCVSSPPKAQPGSSISPTTEPRTTTRPSANATTTTNPRLDPVALAHMVVLTTADVPYSAQAMTAPRDVTRAVEDACRPLESSPYLAAISSNSFETTSKGYSSVVAVEPSEAAAAEVITSLSSQAWEQTCLAPQAKARLAELIKQSGADLPLGCGTNGSDSDSNIPATDLPSGTSGRRVSLRISCSLSEPEDTYYTDVVFAQVGSVVIVFAVEGYDEQPKADDLQIIEAMIDRARDAQLH